MIPSFGGFLYTALAFVVALSIIVFVHEYGHYIVGRWCGIRAEVFSLGFGPVIASWSDRRGTSWQIAALPLGGYVRFAGDADAASRPDGAALKDLDHAARRQTMTGAPLWARAATVAAGPVFNFVLAIALFAGLVMLRGVAIEAPIVGALKPLPVAHQLQPEDRIIAVDGRPVADLESLFALVQDLPAVGLLDYRVDRGGRVLDLPGPHPSPPLVGSVAPQSAAHDVGVQTGDVIMAIEGSPIATFEELRSAVAASDGRAVLMQVWRPAAPETPLEFALTPRRVDLPLPEGGFDTRWMIGITGGLAFAPPTRTPGPLEAISLGSVQTWDILRTSLSGLWHMIVGEISSCNLRGPLGIAETSGAAAAQGWLAFVWFIGMLSAAIGMMNLFPVPVLDGGHLLFHTYEAITGRPPADRVVNALMTAGFAVLIGLMGFALLNDLFCP